MARRTRATTSWDVGPEGLSTRSKPSINGLFNLPDEHLLQRVDAAVAPAVATYWGTETILLAEDEEGVRRFVLESLERRGYRVFGCCNGREAIERARQHPGAIDLLITDAVMPEMGGAELAAQFADCHPGVPVLCMSGYSAMVWPGADAAGAGFLQKPFTPAALLTRVRAMLDRGEASRAA